MVEEPLLQLVDLVVGEGRPRLSTLLRRLPLPEDRHPVPACRRAARLSPLSPCPPRPTRAPRPQAPVPSVSEGGARQSHPSCTPRAAGGGCRPGIPHPTSCYSPGDGEGGREDKRATGRGAGHPPEGGSPPPCEGLTFGRLQHADF